MNVETGVKAPHFSPRCRTALAWPHAAKRSKMTERSSSVSSALAVLAAILARADGSAPPPPPPHVPFDCASLAGRNNSRVYMLWNSGTASWFGALEHDPSTSSLLCLRLGA